MKKKVPFSLDYKEKIESGEVSVITEINRNVRILCWNMKQELPIVALVVHEDNNEEYCVFYDSNGKNELDYDNQLYLLVEDELTEFEQAYSLLRYGSEATAFFKKEQIKQVKEEAATILKYARRQIEKEKVAILKDTEAYNMGLAEGATEALKDMPKWKSCNSDRGIFEAGHQYLRRGPRGSHNVVAVLMGKCDYIDVEDLDKLPKEGEE